MASPDVEAIVLARARTVPAPVAFLDGSLRYFSAAVQSENPWQADNDLRAGGIDAR